MAEMDMKEMINMSKEEVMNVNMEDMTDVNFNDTEDLNMSVMSEVNVDDLMADVAEVQTILQYNNIGQMIDVNEIYEKLEELTYIRREQRIEYVATQLLHKLGVIVEQDVAPEERVFRFSVQRNEDNPVENSHWPHERVAGSEVCGSGGTRTEYGMLYSNDIAASARENYISEPPHDFCQNFMSVPAPDVIFSDALISNQSQTGHSNLEIQSDCCREFDPDVERLINEAKLIYSILPHHDFEQIYACLEANRECDIRIHIVTDMFIQIDAESGVAQLPSVEVTPTSNVDTNHVVSVRTNPAPVYASSVDSFFAPSVDKSTVCPNQTASHDGKFHSIKLSDSANPSLPQNMLADADLKGGDFSSSEHREEGGCRGTNRNDDCEHIRICNNVDVNIENAHRIVTGKLKIEAQHNKGKDNEESGEMTPLSVKETVHEKNVKVIPLSVKQTTHEGSVEVIPLFAEQKVSKDGVEVVPLSAEQKDNEDVEMTPLSVKQKVHEESVEVIPLSPEQKDNKESVDVIPLFPEQKVSKDGVEVMPLSAEQKDDEESVEMTPLSVRQTVHEESVEGKPSSAAERKVCEGNFELAPSSSCKNTVELAASENGDEMFDGIISDEEEEDTLSYNSCEHLDASSANLKQRRHKYHIGDGSNYDIDCEIDESRPSCNVPKIVQPQNLTETSALSSSSQEATDADFAIVHFADLELNDLRQEINDVVTDFETVLLESDTYATERSENRSKCDELNTVTKQEEGCDPASVVELEDYSNESFSNASFDSTNADDLFNFQDSIDEEQEDDKILDKLQELFPDASIDFLTEISNQFNSLMDMANRVLECIEKEQKDGDTLMESVSPVNVRVLASKPPTQGCRKKEITYEEFESSLPHVDPVFLMKKWEMIGNDYNAVKEFIAEQVQETSNNDQYHMLLSLFPHADPTFLREKCDEIGSNEAALKDFIEEQSRNKTDSQYQTLQAIFPQADSAYLHRKIIEIGNDEAAMREFVAEQLKKNEGDDRYHNLLAMFPRADPAFLRENVQRIGDDEDAMRIFVTQLLDEVDAVKFETLLSVLPDADPDYLRLMFDRIGNDEESVKVFLLDSLENKDYPTREAFLKRQEMVTLRRKYKEEFSIEDFIEMIPDPWKHFCEENNNSSELIRNHGMAYLETRYRTIALNNIRMSFQKNNYNLTLTCKELNRWTGPFSPPCNTFTCTVPDTEDIPVSFLQEVAFIENKHRIEDFMVRKEQRKKEAFEMAKANGELLECMCCFDSEVMAEDVATCTDGHLFCKRCVRRAAEVAIGNAQSGFSCLTDCNAEFSLKVLRTVLKPVLFSRMVQMKQLEELQAAGIQDLESCPFCDFATIPPPDSKVFLCYNQNCMRDSCRKCKRPNHIPLRCDEVESKEVKMRTYIENRMTDALVRSCWKCKKQFIKEAGCNKMTCTCGALMCYICRQPVTNYSHFNGQGGTEFDKCPLYSDLQVIHDVAVQEEGIKAKKIVQAENPDIELKHDPTQPVGIPQ